MNAIDWMRGAMDGASYDEINEDLRGTFPSTLRDGTTVAFLSDGHALIWGEGDAKRVAIFAQSYGKDPSFAAFFRTMQAYDVALAQGDTTMVVAPNSAFFKYYNDGPGK